MKKTILGKEYTDGQMVSQEKDEPETSYEIEGRLEQLLRVTAERFFLSAGFAPALIEDLVQEAFLRLSRARCRGIQANLDYWHKICLSVKNDYLRRQCVCPSVLPLESVSTVATEVNLENQIINHVWYEQCLSLLTEIECYIVRMHLEEGCTFIEIAEQVGKKPEGVKKIYQRTIIKLRQKEILYGQPFK